MLEFFYIFSLFTYGICMQIDHIYPSVEYPVSRNTPMIAPLIRYDHGQNWSVPNLSTSKNSSFERTVTIDISQEQYQYLSGHIVDGIFAL